MTFQITKCIEQDIPELFELFAHAYPNNPRLTEKKFFDWQFYQNPFADQSEYTFLICRRNNKIQSILGYIPFELIYHKGKMKACFTCNWYSFGKDLSGLFIYKHLQSKYKFIVVAGMSDDTKKIFSKFKIPFTDPIPRWIAFPNAEKAFQFFQIQENDKKTIFQSSEKLKKLTPLKDIMEIKQFDSSLEIPLQIKNNNDIFCNLTPEYLNWRYVNIPRHDYSIIAGHHNQYSVFRVEKIMNHDKTMIKIMEWTFDNEQSRMAVNHIYNIAKKQNSICIDFFSTSITQGKILEKLGFINNTDLSTKIPNQFRPLNYTDDFRIAFDFRSDGDNQCIDGKRLYFTKGAGDLDRIKL